MVSTQIAQALGFSLEKTQTLRNKREKEKQEVASREGNLGNDFSYKNLRKSSCCVLRVSSTFGLKAGKRMRADLNRYPPFLEHYVIPPCHKTKGEELAKAAPFVGVPLFLVAFSHDSVCHQCWLSYYYINRSLGRSLYNGGAFVTYLKSNDSRNTVRTEMITI